MLGKLIQYDICRYKYYLYIYIAVPILALVTRFTNSIPDKSVAVVIIDKVLSGFTIGMIAGLFVNIIMRIFVRYDLSIFGDEGYLTHTLPVKRGDIYTAKGLSAIIIIVLSYLISALGFGIVTYGAFDLTHRYKAILISGSVALLEIFCIVFTVFLGITLGNRRNTHKKLYSIIYSVLIYIAEQLPILVVMLIMLGDVIFTENDDQINGMIANALYVCMAFYAVYCVVLFILGKKALEKGVNID